MSAVTLSSFDTLRYVQRLRSANVPEAQAEAQAEALREVLAEQAGVQSNASARMVSESDTKTENAILRLEQHIVMVRKDVDALEQRLNARTDAMENRLIIKLSAVMVGLIAFAGAMQAVVSRL